MKLRVGKGRRRLPSNVMELSGAFARDPKRRRYDPEPKRPLSTIPPTDLPRGAVSIWHTLIDEFPNITITQSDAQAVRMLALALYLNKLAFDNNDVREFIRTEQVVRCYLVHFGMTPASRTRFATKTKPVEDDNEFTRIRGQAR